jgi:hypothetical protein
MGWSIGFDEKWNRDIGYGVPAYCDAPGCTTQIDRGLTYVCGGEPYGGDRGCGLYFCEKHREFQLCARCTSYKPPYKRIKPDHPDWIQHKLTDPSWEEWRKENSQEVRRLLQTSLSPELIAGLFHETYERLAPSFGYVTRKASAVPWGEIPEDDRNRKLMVAVCREILGLLRLSIQQQTMQESAEDKEELKQ